MSLRDHAPAPARERSAALWMSSASWRRCSAGVSMASVLLGCTELMAPAGSQGSGGDGTDLLSGIDQYEPTASYGGAAGSSSSSGGAAGSGALATGGAALGGETASAGAITTGFEVLADSLSGVHAPSVGRDGVSVTGYTSASSAMVLFVGWDRAVAQWYEASGAYFAYTAASGPHHLALLQQGGGAGIHEGGGAELSGTPAIYKEFLAANEDGFAWVDYESAPASGGAGGVSIPNAGTQIPDAGAGLPLSGGAEALGRIAFEAWSGARTTLTDNMRYRARLDLSGTHLTFVEYASTAAGAVGQVMVQPLPAGTPAPAAASPRHQDRPAIDGEWVVWEEYSGAADVVIRARNLVTGELRDVSATTGYRTNPDILGTVVVWEDQRSGDGDIYVRDLGSSDAERVAVSGAGHSSGARLTPDGLVWMEVNQNNVGLLRARWSGPL